MLRILQGVNLDLNWAGSRWWRAHDWVVNEQLAVKVYQWVVEWVDEKLVWVDKRWWWCEDGAETKKTSVGWHDIKSNRRVYTNIKIGDFAKNSSRSWANNLTYCELDRHFWN